MGSEMPDPPLIPVATCQGCGATKALSDLTSKYGRPQLVGEIKGAHLWEAQCEWCDAGKGKNKVISLQAIWKEIT